MLDDIMARLASMPSKQKQEVMARVAESMKKQVWVPNPGPQYEAFHSRADELFYGGAAGGGKTEMGLGLALTQHRRSLMLREYLDDARDMAERMLTIAGSREGWNGQLLHYRNGPLSIDFGGCRNDADKQRFKGQPHDLIFFDEVSDFLESVYLFIITWNRSTTPGQRCRVVAAGNPPTRPEGLWVIRRWAAWLDPRHPNPAEPGELRWYVTNADGKELEVPDRGPHRIDGEEVYARSRTFIPAKLEDNPDLMQTDYHATLAALSPDLRAAYRDGRFDASLKDAPDQAIPTAWVKAAQERWSPRPPDGVPMCAMGVDCSGGGDDPMVIAKRYDGWYAPLVEIPGRTIPMERAGAFSAGMIISHRANAAPVIVDMGGGYGGPTFEMLRSNQVETIAYKGAEGTNRRSRDGRLRFVNKRSAAYWLFREALDPGQPGGSPIMLPDDPGLVADLTAPTVSTTPNGLKIEAKEAVCDRLGRSTDRGDAVVMAWFEGEKAITAAMEWQGRQQQGMRGRHAVVNSHQPLSARLRRSA